MSFKSAVEKHTLQKQSKRCAQYCEIALLIRDQQDDFF